MIFWCMYDRAVRPLRTGRRLIRFYVCQIEENGTAFRIHAGPGMIHEAQFARISHRNREPPLLKEAPTQVLFSVRSVLSEWSEVSRLTAL
jgi:hypothetical protein